MRAHALESEGDVNLLIPDIHEPHHVAGLLKKFLRDLPSSLWAPDLYNRLLASAGRCSTTILFTF